MTIFPIFMKPPHFSYSSPHEQNQRRKEWFLSEPEVDDKTRLILNAEGELWAVNEDDSKGVCIGYNLTHIRKLKEAVLEAERIYQERFPTRTSDF